MDGRFLLQARAKFIEFGKNFKLAIHIKMDEADRESRYDDLLRNIPDGVYIFKFDAEGKMGFTYVSPRFCEILGIEAASVLEDYTIAFGFAHLSDFEGLVQANELSRFQLEQFRWEGRFIIRGETRWVRITSEPTITPGAGSLWHGVISDITEQKRTQQQLESALSEQRLQNEALKKLEERQKQLLQKLQVGIVVHAPDSTILFSNPRAAELLGLSGDQMQGKVAIDPAWRFLDESGAPFRVEDYPVSRVITTKQSFIESILGINSPTRNSIVWVLVSAFPELNESGQLKEIVVNFHDVTERKLARDELEYQKKHLEKLVEERTRELSKALEEIQATQEDLIQSEKLASLGSLVAGISHELNTPLGNAILMSSSLVDQLGLFKQILQGDMIKRSDLINWLGGTEEMALLCERSLNRASALVASFKQVAIDQTSERRRIFDLHDSVEDILTTLRPALKNKPWIIVNEIKQGIKCDGFPGPMGQIITNLVQNAVLHGFEGRTGGLVTIAAKLESSKVDLSVTDDGNGMSAAILSHIFDPFFTTKLGKGGSGLGLAICHRIATSVLLGDIRVVSAPGSGTRFVLSMPLRIPGEL